jgi:hypothetical protein
MGNNIYSYTGKFNPKRRALLRAWFSWRKGKIL